MTAVAVASPLRSATEAGRDAVSRGGNAIDAAVATAAMLAVAYPHNCGLGGDLLALVREPDGRVTFINASGAAPQAIDVDAVRSRYEAVPAHGPLPVTVPGAVGGWDALVRRGAALSWVELLTPAASAARDGVAVSPGVATAIAATTPYLAAYPELAALIAPNAEPLTFGQTLRQPSLARTLDTIAHSGSDALYDGDLSNDLCAGLAARGVPITRSDLREFAIEEEPPVTAEIAGWQVRAGRPNSQAYQVPRLLAMLAAVDATDGSDTAALHRRVSAARLALAFAISQSERDAVLGDPRFMTHDVAELLTPEASAQFAERVLSTSLAERTTATPKARPTGDTVAVVAADDEGRSVSLIQSLFNGFGSLILEPTTGLILHDRGACFVLDPASPNVLAPGKRPLHTLSPVLAESTSDTNLSDTNRADTNRADTNRSERLVVGTMGGHAQPQILMQVLSQLFAGASAQDAVGRPRLTVGAWQDDESADTVAWETDLDADMLGELSGYPGPHVPVAPHHSRMGHAHAIRVTASSMDVGTDPRADG